MGVTWWVWVSCGSARWVLPLWRGDGMTAWVAARFQALTSRFGSFTHGVGSGKVSRLSLSFFFFFLKSLSLSLSCLSLRFSFLFFSFGFPFGLRRLESSVGLLGLHFWTKIFFFFFLHVGWPVGLERPKSSFFLKINLLKFIYLFIFYRWAGRLGYNFRGGSSYL